MNGWQASAIPKHGVLRHSHWDALFIALAGLHGILLLQVPSIPLIAILLWWNANTISHNFIHLPFFRSRYGNALFSGYLSLVLGIPQTLWSERHLAHHAGKPFRLRISRPMVVETSLVLVLWCLLFLLVRKLFFVTYLPGFFLGLGLCQVQGMFEHANGTTSHYGALYNFLFFNDGYHVEHHARPATHWTQLRLRAAGKGKASRWPALLRWIEFINLDGLERLALRSRLLQSLMISSHERAFRRLLSCPWNIRRVSIVGGALFPRTALILQRLVPHAPLRIIDVSAENWERARSFLNRDVEFVHELYSPSGSPTQDLVVIPLAYIGERVKIYQDPPASIVLVHDWIWRRRGESVIISWLLLKRLNLIRR